jgi:beta-glucosidase
MIFSRIKLLPAIKKQLRRTATALLSFILILPLCLPAAAQVQGVAGAPPDYLNPQLPIERRVADLVGRMTLEEKIAQMMNKSPAIARLNVPDYDWWNEALHGVAYAGHATVFPQAIGLGATWNPALMQRVATAISDEARAKYHEAVKRDFRKRFYGLTFWSPNINIFRDPRWGRGQETYGEDPFLTARLGVAFVRGMQGDDSRYLKVIATPKHYAVHSGPEPERHVFDATVGERDFRETYLPAFQAAIVEGKAGSVMCAYNRVNGEPACASKRLMTDILRTEWGFDGYVVSDCDAVLDIYKNHKFVKTKKRASRLPSKRDRVDLRLRVSRAHPGHQTGAYQRSGDRYSGQAPVHRALPPRHVRPARNGSLLAHPVRGERLGGAPRTGARRSP